MRRIKRKQTETDRKEAVQDEIMKALEAEYQKETDNESKLRYAKQLARIEALFNYQPGTWVPAEKTKKETIK